MIELGWAIADEDLGVVSCDGMICSTPSGSTAYNLSNGGPVLVRGLDAMAITFIAPHSLDARPLVVPRGAELTVRNATSDVGAAVLADGHESGELVPGRTLSIRLGEQRSLLATLPETTFFGALPRDLHVLEADQNGQRRAAGLRSAACSGVSASRTSSSSVRPSSSSRPD